MEKNAAFAEKFAFPFPLLSDPDRQMGLAYGACDTLDAPRAKRISYLLDAEGVVAKVYPTVDTKQHPTEVLRDAKAL